MTDLEKYEAQGPLSGNPAHVRLTIDEVGRISEIVAASGLWSTRVKENGQWITRDYTRAECWAIIMAGQSLGVAPIPAMSSFHMIEGRAEMSANLQAYFLKSSPKYDYRMNFEYLESGSVDACKIVVYDKQRGEAIGESRFTKAMAQKAGLIRQGGNWDKYAESMLFARAVSNAVAWHAPDAVPMRIYSDGEAGDQHDEPVVKGVSAVQGEGPQSTSKVEAAITQALDAEEEIQDAEIVEPDPNVGRPDEPYGQSTIDNDKRAGIRIGTASEYDRFRASNPNSDLTEEQFEALRAHPDPAGMAAAMAEASAIDDRFSAAAVETRLRADLPKLDENAKDAIKAMVAEAELPFSYASIVKLIVDAGYTDVFSWLRAAQDKLTGASAPADDAQPHTGMSGAQTGSQTAMTISDAQIRKFNAKCGEAGFSELERKAFLHKIAQVGSSKAIAKDHFDDILAALKDIIEGGPETKAAYLHE